jgi:hypothetical protein
VVVCMRVVCRADVVHLVRRTALHAASLRLLAGQGDPEHAVRARRKASASAVLLVTGRVNNDRVLRGTCTSISLYLCRTRTSPLSPIPFPLESLAWATYQGDWSPMVSCRRYRHPAPFPKVQDAPNRWLVRCRWGRYRASHPARRGRLRS